MDDVFFKIFIGIVAILILWYVKDIKDLLGKS